MAPFCCGCLLYFQGIYDTLKKCANISKCAGGIGLAVHRIRCAGSYIAGVGISVISSLAISLFLC